MVRTPVQTNHMCDCPNRLHIDVVGTAATNKATTTTTKAAATTTTTTMADTVGGMSTTG